VSLLDTIHHFKEPKPAGRDKWMALCQAHPDGEKRDRASLSLRIVTDGDEQKILVKCFAGCTAVAAVTAAGLTMADLFERQTGRTFVGKRTVVAAYDYVTVDGELRYQAVRYDPKGFSQRRPDPASPHHNPPAWINDMRGVEPLLYRFDKIQQAEKTRRWLCITEGEKDADALAALGLPATTNHGGADQWKDAHTQQVLAISPDLVVIFEDHDDAGMKRTARFAPAFLAAGVSVKVITSAELGGLPPKGDISDWLAADPTHDRDTLLKIIKETRQYVTTPTGSAPKLMTVSEMQSRLGRHTDWLVDRMLAVGDLSLLVAKPGVGKSTFAAQLAVAVAYGKPFLGRAVRQGVVVILAFEGARSTMAQMVRLGHDPESAQILIWNAEADTGDPVAWLDDTMKGVQPALIIVDTLADLVRVRHGAANAGYEETVAKLGAVYVWAQARRAHIHLLHHGGKGDREGIDTALGTIGIVSKPGTVLDYRPMSKTDGAPRVLKGIKHREGDPEDLPAIVLDFDREVGLTVAGYRDDVALREMGVAIVKVVAKAPEIRLADTLDAVEGRKTVKLETLRHLTDPKTGVLIQTGTPKSKAFPLRLSVRPDLAGDPVEVWRRSRILVPENHLGSQNAGTKINGVDKDENHLGSRCIVQVRNQDDQNGSGQHLGSREYIGDLGSAPDREAL
jgi:hypothetical protein